MFLAWKCGIKIRINHSHMAEKPEGLKNKIYYGLRLYFGKLFQQIILHVDVMLAYIYLEKNQLIQEK